jgi:hypothetical protein
MSIAEGILRERIAFCRLKEKKPTKTGRGGRPEQCMYIKTSLD